MRVLIIEAEKLAAQHLTALLNRYQEGFEVVAPLKSVKNSIEWLKLHENRYTLSLWIYN